MAGLSREMKRQCQFAIRDINAHQPYMLNPNRNYFRVYNGGQLVAGTNKTLRFQSAHAAQYPAGTSWYQMVRNS